MDILIVFIVAFIAELCAAGYTIALARGNAAVAVVASLLIGIINWGIVLFVIDNHTLVLPSVLGEVVGTAVAMRVARGK
jgi:hypothetical protein